VLVCGGLAVALSSKADPNDFGWFAYAPSSGNPDWNMTWGDPRSNGSALIVSRWQLAGSAVVALGLMIIAAGMGFQLGRRRIKHREQP
jgi:hypothetical protein